MRVVVLGANGRTGRLVVETALARGALVTAVVRGQEKAPEVQHRRLRCDVGDPCDPAFLTRAFTDQDAVISTLGGRRPTRAASAVYWRSAAAIVEAAQRTGLCKVVVTSSALLFPSAGLIDRVLKTLVQRTVSSAVRMEGVLKATDLDVVVARCGFLTDGEDPRYRATAGALPEAGKSLARQALAHFLLDALDLPITGVEIFGVSAARGRYPMGSQEPR